MIKIHMTNISETGWPELRNFEPFFKRNNQIKEFYRYVFMILNEFHLKKETIIFFTIHYLTSLF